MVRRLASDAKLELSAHTLRHTAVTNLVRSGGDVVMVAEIAGHRRLDTTRRYSLPSEADKDAGLGGGPGRGLSRHGAGPTWRALLPDDELERLATWPPEVSRADLVAHFILSLDDARWVRSFRSPRARADRLGLAVQLCALRFLGFVPAYLAATPGEVVQRLADQLGVPAGGLSRYADQVSGRSRREHVASVVAQARWRACGRGEWKALGDWLVARALVARALEHDTPSVLFALALEHLRAEHVVRPGLDRLVRAVATARANVNRRGPSPARPGPRPRTSCTTERLGRDRP